MVEISSLSNIVMVTLCTAFLWDNETVKKYIYHIQYTVHTVYIIISADISVSAFNFPKYRLSVSVPKSHIGRAHSFVLIND